MKLEPLLADLAPQTKSLNADEIKRMRQASDPHYKGTSSRYS